MRLGSVGNPLAGLQLLVSGTQPFDQEGFNSFVKETILQDLGAEALFECFDQTLEDDVQDDRLTTALPVIIELASHSALRPLLKRYNLFQRVVTLLYRSSFLDAKDSKGCWLKWQISYLLFVYVP